jgi:hypothetical protein
MGKHPVGHQAGRNSVREVQKRCRTRKFAERLKKNEFTFAISCNALFQGTNVFLAKKYKKLNKSSKCGRRNGREKNELHTCRRSGRRKEPTRSEKNGK